MSETSYFEDDDGVWAFAGIGAFAIEGLLRIRTPVTPESRWEWLQPPSQEWNGAHQKIYRNFRVTQMEVRDIERLPPLPEGPPPERSIPAEPVYECANYPALSRLLRASDPEPLWLCVILSEDTYESFSGDGKFHDFEAIRLTEEAAHEYIEADPADMTAYHLRRLRLSLEGDLIRYHLQKEVFDCCDIAVMFAAAEELAASERETSHT